MWRRPPTAEAPCAGCEAGKKRPGTPGLARLLPFPWNERGVNPPLMRKPVRVVAVVTACLLFLLGSATAEDEEQPKQGPPKPLTTQQAADAVASAVTSQDGKELTTLALQDKPDPWLVADLLCYRGNHDAAEAFAKAARRVDVEQLPAHVEAWRKRKPDTAERELLTKMRAALRAGTPAQILAGTASLPTPLNTITRIRLHHVRGLALRTARQHGQTKDLLQRAAAAAHALGWLRQGARLYNEAATSAYFDANWPDAVLLLGKAVVLTEQRGDQQGAARALSRLGIIHGLLGDYAAALSVYERALERMRALGDERGVATTQGNLGLVYFNLGKHAKALAIFEHALKLKQALGGRGATSAVLTNIGMTHRALGNYAKALSVYERALEQTRTLGDQRGAARVLSGIGLVHESRGDHAEALSTYERAHEQLEALGAKQAATNTLANMGNLYRVLGEYAKALSILERALEQHRSRGDKRGAAGTLANIGAVHQRLGDYARALSIYEDALELLQELGDEKRIVAALANTALVHQELGHYAKALAMLEGALERQQTLDDKQGVATTLGNIGNIHQSLGDRAKALSFHERALRQRRALGDKWGVALSLSNIGVVQEHLGEPAKALATLELALEQKRALGDKRGAAMTLRHIGRVHLALGDHAKARRALERSVSAARSLRAAPILVTALKRLAHLHLAMGKPSRALARAREALREAEGLLGGLDGEQGATARGQHTNLFAVGVLAAAREGEPAEALTFLESGRAGSLLDALDKREALRWKAESLPPDLRQEDREARAAEKVARRAYDRATRRGKLIASRAAATVLSDATERVRAIDGRIQRDLKKRLKQQAGLFYPRPKTIYDIQDALEADQALVLYGLCLDEALALVLRPDGERIVELGKASDVQAACAALDASDADVDPAKALAALKALLVDPLKLGKDVKQVMVSPEGPLCYVPFGALFQQTVAMTPSGTTHVLLLDEEREAGTGVLSLGSPDYSGVSDRAKAIYYRGRSLSPLPATAPEATTVGTVSLIGAKASEAGLRVSLKEQKRWKAVHFACHGLIDVDRPMLSSLALSRAGEDDGFLTALEVLRMQIPADLAVLSACETGRGRVVKGEGILGLTRAFMFAGAPRVICSLWKVDDAATKALMVRFYELWNPKDGKKGLGAAAALRKAQAFVRDHPNGKWKHPYYWAAWVLWGLPN